jgi:hypothetical protein
MPDSKLIPLKEFDALLARHDWFYAFSDDHRVWSSGKATSEKLQHIAESSPAHKHLYQLWSSHIRTLMQNSPEHANSLREIFHAEKLDYLDSLSH